VRLILLEKKIYDDRVCMTILISCGGLASDPENSAREYANYIAPIAEFPEWLQDLGNSVNWIIFAGCPRWAAARPGGQPDNEPRREARPKFAPPGGKILLAN
jgi:hypothetical protein